MNPQAIIESRRTVAAGLEQFMELTDDDYQDGCIVLGFLAYVEVATPDGKRKEMQCVTGSVDGSAGSLWQLKGYFAHMTPAVGRVLS